MATLVAAPVTDETVKNDVGSLLQLVRAHQSQHEDPAYDSRSPAAIYRCKTMLTKLRKLLPKLMRPVTKLSSTGAVSVLQDLCELLLLLLGGDVCPHSMTLFTESSNVETSGAHGGDRLTSSSGFPSYPTMATLLFYMVSFYTSERLRPAQHNVRLVTLQMVLFLQRNDVYGFIHFFRDTVQLVEDCFLLEESLVDQHLTDSVLSGASIACYLDTAIHVYQDVDGPLGAKSSPILCGCMPITDFIELQERREQLKQLMPSIHVSSYGAVVALRHSTVVLVDQIICQHSVLLERDVHFDRLCLLVKLFVDKNETIVNAAKSTCVNGALSSQDAEDVARSTLRLLHTMLQISMSTERRFVHLALIYFKYSHFHETNPRISQAWDFILQLIGKGYPHLSSFATDALWPQFETWITGIMHIVRGTVHESRCGVKLMFWMPVLSILRVYTRQPNGASPASLYVELLECFDTRIYDPALVSSIIDDVHHMLSTKEMLTKVVRFISGRLISSNADRAAGPSQSVNTARKRKRNDASLDNQVPFSDLSHENSTELHEQLGQWILDLMSVNSNDRKSIVAISMSLRVILPLRHYILAFIRLESFVIFRTLLQRVDLIVNTHAPSLVSLSSEYLELWIIMLRYFADHELEKYRELLNKVIDSVANQQIFARSPEQEKTFVVPDCWEYLTFLDLYQRRPNCHDMSSSEGLDEVSYDYLRSADAVLDCAFQQSVVLLGPFLIYFVWSRPVVLSIDDEDSWRNALPWKAVCWAISQQVSAHVTACSYLAMTPLLAYFVVAGSLASPEKMTVCLMETFRDKVQRTGSETISLSVIQACGAVLCAMAYAQASTDRGNILRDKKYVALRSRTKSCQCQNICSNFQIMPVSLALFEAIICDDANTATESVQVARINALSCALTHCEVDYRKDQASMRFVERFLACFAGRSVPAHQAVLESFVHQPRLLDAMIDPAKKGLAGLTERLESFTTVADDSSDDTIVAAIMLTSGSVGCEFDPRQKDRAEHCIWILLRLVSWWNRFHVAHRERCAGMAYDQICRITAHHRVSWRRLCVDFPDLIYFPLVDEVLKTQTLKLFLSTFMGGKVATNVFLRVSAPYVLPKYVAQQNERKLHAFVDEYNGQQENTAVIENDTDGEPLLSVTDFFLNHIEYVLKDLIIHQVSTQNRLAEWEFLFKFLPENSTIRDVITHSPLRLMNLLAWELGGSRSRMAKRAIREVARYMHGGAQEALSIRQDANLQPVEVRMSRQYFLALMTDLGNRIIGTNLNSAKIRAIKSIDQLLEIVGGSRLDSDGTQSRGIVDPFVPKVMATLKVGLTERALQEHAIIAWGNFLRMLSSKALGSNLSSIVVSLLPCLGFETSAILIEDSSVSSSQCWNLESLKHATSDGCAQVMALRDDGEVQAQCMVAAKNVLRYLFIEKETELKHAFPKIPLLPSIPELDDIYVVLYRDYGDPRCRSLSEYLMNLSAYVNHLDTAVREVALTQLLRCLVVRGEELGVLMQNEGSIFIDSVIATVLRSVLQLASTERNESVKLLCARCLGALGGVDGARIPLNMFYTSGGPQKNGAGAKEKLCHSVEYSTKDLACALIESWLVNELRAAPENTDSLAFAIQELLKFLADLTADPQHSGQSLASTNNLGPSYKTQQGTGACMPEWMKRRFERKDVLQFVEPYWSTNYSVLGGRSSHSNSSSCSDRRSSASVDRSLHHVRDGISFYEKYGTSYEEWLLMWCRRLIQLSQPPGRKIFWACKTALATCPQISRFLLPYLVQNVLRSGRSEVGEELKKEFMAVLDGQDCGILMDDFLVALPDSEHSDESMSASDVSEKTAGESYHRHDQCSQTIFSTIDELNEWIWTSEKKRLALSSSAGSRQTAASGRSDVPSDMDDYEKDYLDEFLKEIPSRLLSSAAYKVKAYARAIQYFEVYLRQQEFTSANEKRSSVEMAGPVHPSLISQNALFLQQLYKSVDEPDALIGLASLRRLYEANRYNDIRTNLEGETQEEGLNLTSLMHQVVDHEQLAQWEDALACYEQAIQGIQSALSSKLLPTSRPHYSQLAMMQPTVQISDADAHKDPEMIKPILYSGMVGCLIQLGRLESALQHINGIVTQEPQFTATMYPLALECSWRLSRWELLTELLSAEKRNPLLHSLGSASTRLKGFDVSQLMLVRVLHSLHVGQQEEFQRHLKAARLEVMGPLAAASAESYQRAYPLLHDLHFLHEAEQGFIFLQKARQCDDPGQRSLLWKEQAPWKMRYDAMATQLKYRDPILALRRVILQEAGLRNEVSTNWLLYANLTRKEGFFRTAASAVMHAEALNNQYARIEKAKLLVSQDRMYEALQLLEPIAVDVSTLDFDVEDPHFCARNLLLATNWMQESGLRQGRKVIERYQAVIRFDPTWEKGYFFLAKYYEYLLSESHPDALNGSMGSDEVADLLVDSVFHAHLINLMKNFVLALAHGTKFVFQSLPRLLTLWFEYGETLYTSTAGQSSVANTTLRQVTQAPSTTEQKVLDDITIVIDEAIELLPAYEWLVCFPQVTSRICHPNPVVVSNVKKIMLRVATAYPTQAMWPLLGLSLSLNPQRRKHARDIIFSAQQNFISQGLEDIAASFAEGMRLAEELISLAAHDPGNSQRKIHIRLSRVRTKILVPTQVALTTILPATGLAPRDESHVAFSSNAQVYIKGFRDKADVMMTKEKPKRIEILGTDGVSYPFLCKREKSGDLRKDARMMEFNSMINRLLQKDKEGRKRKLRLRTYAVVCLNEESGLMEWVQHTKTMRQLIGQIYKTERGYIQPVRVTHEIKEQYLTMQKEYANNPGAMAQNYRRKILSLPVFTPRFHQWFYNNFADPTAWFEARLAFSRSTAVWSMVGHIVGLGDRHCENILIDCTNGECIHVDFDCLFDKGLKLAKPEIVPFRLTPNIVDAFGITGYEGVFRRVSEVTLHLLRDNKETLRSVLESFIHDPLVEWGRRGKATQSSGGSGKIVAEVPSERTKMETRLVLKAIDDRLRGTYNLGDAIRPLVSRAHRSILPEVETLPLSVQGQVEKLIHEATLHENLAQMYIGWMPFL
uniref:Serine/threonine-protein kinase ATR n=1 Tax=Peronospora matthiolae TaxID=2874970 RepID=A0AAV1TA85_9STRA